MKRAGGVGMKITKYPQSCFLIEAEGKKILIDLGNLVFELHDIKLEDFREIDIVLLTHKHDDHCYPEALKTIVENNTPLILTNPEVQEIIKNNGIESELIAIDEERAFGNVKIRAVPALHGYNVNMKDKGYPKDNNGFLITDTITSVYHCSDTICFENKTKADVVLVPICGHAVVMEPDVALEFCSAINPKLIVPMHYHSDKHPLGTEKFEELAQKASVDYKVLKEGEEIEL